MKQYKPAESTNLTLILPVNCNASCSFCFWQKQERINKELWLQSLKKSLDLIGDKIGSISISGGEPTFDKDLLLKTLIIIKQFNKNNLKVVLNTNGLNLKELLKSLIFNSTVNIINLSRHEIKDEDNDKILNSKGLTTEEIKEIINYIESETRITVSINKVVTEKTTKQDLINFIDFTKEVKANNLVFRELVTDKLEPANDLDLELSFNKRVTVNSCPVCRTREYFKFGTQIIFKYGVKDTFDYFKNENMIYEFIFNEKGIIAYDWAGNTNYKSALKKEELKNKLDEPMLIQNNSGLISTNRKIYYTNDANSNTLRTVNNVSYGCGRSSGC